MSQHSIRLVNLGKQYRLGKRESYQTLRETIVDSLSRPVRALKNVVSRRHSNEGVDTFWALKDVSFDVKVGEVLGVIGRNGAGKSTLLKIISRITSPTVGAVEVRGRVGSLLEVGTGFHPELTGRENVFLSGAILGMKRAEIAKKFDEMVAFAEVERFIDTPVKHYSSGMYLRLAFAVAAHLEPEILLVDEVLAVGDMRFQRKCIDKMQDVGQHGRTVLFVSHNMPAITRLCQRAVLFEEGALTQFGPAVDVVGSYLQAGMGTTAVREWTDPARMPGSDSVRLRAVRIRDESGGDRRYRRYPKASRRRARIRRAPGRSHVVATLRHAQHAGHHRVCGIRSGPGMARASATGWSIPQHRVDSGQSPFRRRDAGWSGYPLAGAEHPALLRA